MGIDPRKVDNKKGYLPKQAAKAKKIQSRAKAIETRQQAAVEEKAKLLKNIETAADLKLSPIKYYVNRLLLLRDLVVDYGGGPVCVPVSFEIQRGERVALRGRNGSGKSSLLKLICGENIPHSGVYEKGSGLKISYVAQDTSHLRGNLRDYARKQDIDESLFKAILRKLDFSREQFDKDIVHFSGGQKKKVLIAASLCQEAHLYIWDEPMNYVDVLSRMQIEELLLRFTPTLLFVEHDRTFCERIATKTILLDSGERIR